MNFQKNKGIVSCHQFWVNMPLFICILLFKEIRNNLVGSQYIRLWFVLMNKIIFVVKRCWRKKRNFRLIYWKYVNVWYLITWACINVFGQSYLPLLRRIDLLFVYWNTASELKAFLLIEWNISVFRRPSVDKKMPFWYCSLMIYVSSN